MKNKLKNSIFWKLISYFFIVIILTSGIIILVAVNSPRKLQEERQNFEMSIRADAVYEYLMAQSKKINTLEELSRDTGRISLMSGIIIKILDKNGELVFATPLPGPDMEDFFKFQLTEQKLSRLKKGNMIEGYFQIDLNNNLLTMNYNGYPLYINNNLAGFIILNFPQGPPKPRMSQVGVILINAVIIAVLIAMAAAGVLSWNFLKPIKKLKLAAHNISEGSFETPVDTSRADELGTLARAFEKMARKLDKVISNRLKLMGDISHELNTPITSIRANTEAILDGIIETDEEKQKSMEAILNQTRRISLLVDDILELSKFEAGEIKLNIQAFDALAPVERVLETTNLLAEQKNARIETNIEIKEKTALGDQHRITQVIQNLVNNALYHNENGVLIVLNVFESKENIVYEITDNGKGIPKNEIDHIFERFHKVDKSRTRRESGSGLGLAIVREIIDAHDSEIKVESSPGKTRFRFSLKKAE
ncbi:MAG: sensor histidine kinase [Vulcanimicrobiota bacterium]